MNHHRTDRKPLPHRSRRYLNYRTPHQRKKKKKRRTTAQIATLLRRTTTQIATLLFREASTGLARENEGSTRKVRKLISTCCTNISVDDSMLDRGTASEIKDISGKLEGLSKRISMLNLVENVRATRYRTGERFQIASFTEESEVVSEAYSLS
ncbi:unnamed protein product [Fraxinus pennsylvanica]|uniref:Uncharacterized protein n=1 Tax=Fraxinus pennsylvanica TaxID=56036 RepID=A0AAD1YXT9_9LAMI|nr:unnamed protein product [Fraxinus pennsylvanica]